MENDIWHKNKTIVMVPQGEPTLDWSAVRKTLTWLWPFHYFAFGCVSLLLSVFSLNCIYRITRTDTKAPRRYFMTVAFMLIFFGLTRGIYLLLDPYGSHAHFNLPTVAEALLRGLAYLCLTSSFTLFSFLYLKSLSCNFFLAVSKEPGLLHRLCCYILSLLRAQT